MSIDKLFQLYAAPASSTQKILNNTCRILPAYRAVQDLDSDSSASGKSRQLVDCIMYNRIGIKGGLKAFCCI